MNKKIEMFSIALVFFIGLFLWSIPVNNLPFGDVDASTHFILGDYMAQTDRPLFYIPYFLNQYYFANSGKIWYPPQFHTDEAIISSLSGERVAAVYLFNALVCSLIILSTYLIIRKTFGFYAAILSAFMIIFSVRDYMFYLFGLWPQTLAFAFTPFILYLFYSYYSSEERNIAYLYLCSLALAIQILLHPQGFVYSAAIIAIYAAAQYIINRKIKFELKHLILSMLLFLMIITPFFAITFKGVIGSEASEPLKLGNMLRLFSWYPDSKDFAGSVPESFFSYSAMYGLWTLPLLIGGLIFLFINFKKNSSILMLSWIFAYYLFMHLDVIGKGSRIARFIGVEGHIFYPLFALGIFFLIGLIKNILPEALAKHSKPAAALIIAAIFIFAVAPDTYSAFKGAYAGPLGRVTASEFETANQIKGIIQNEDIYLVGGMVSSKNKFMRVLSYNYMNWSRNVIPENNISDQFILIDYTEPLASGRNDLVSAMQQWESSLTDYTLIYLTDDKILRFYKKNEEAQ